MFSTVFRVSFFFFFYFCVFDFLCFLCLLFNLCYVVKLVCRLFCSHRLDRIIGALKSKRRKLELVLE